MDFSLTYRGRLYSNGSTKHKQELRRHFHDQLAMLWNQHPLSQHQHFLIKETPDPSQAKGSLVSLVRQVEGFDFVPLVNKDLNLVAELEIQIFRPEQAGQLITQSGDIDNRLKTLFDALQMPKPNQVVPPKEEGNLDFPSPFFCLLEDDNLIIKVAVQNNQLLERNVEESEVLLIIQVKVRKTTITTKNFTFA